MASLYEKFLHVFGDIKVFRWPMFLLYQPYGYLLRGRDVREVIEAVQPGDILVRSYRNYLDGHFIPGYFSHIGLYLGEVTEADKELVPRTRDGKVPERFLSGEQVVIHALAEGTLMEDLLHFCRCDHMAILRFPKEITAINKQWQSLAELSDEEQTHFDALRSGDSLPFEAVWPLIRKVSLSSLGTPYDFHFQFDRFETLSCSELVYFATKCLGPFLNVTVQDHAFMSVIKRSLILPDDFVASPLQLIWKSHSVPEQQISKLR